VALFSASVQPRKLRVMNPATHHCSTLLQIWVKRIIVGIDDEVIEHELILSFAYLRSLLQNLSFPGSRDGGSEHVRLGVSVCQKPPTKDVERFLSMLRFDSRGKVIALDIL
jgi:hypothetical protein